VIPTGWYSLTQSILILVGAALAFAGRDKRLWWPAGAMLLSLASARLATGLADLTLPILLIATPVSALAAARGRTAVSRVIAITYTPRLLCYAAYALGILPLWAMWEFSNFFLNIQIVALFTGAIGGGNLAPAWLAVVRRLYGGDATPAGSFSPPWRALEHNPGSGVERHPVAGPGADAAG
jgi:hypothetical protein